MSYDLGLKTLKRMCLEQNPMAWHRAKLSDSLFRGPEKQVFAWVDQHVRKYHALPQMDTLVQAHPMMNAVHVPEPVLYYVEKIERAYFYSVINNANVESQTIIKTDQDNFEDAANVLRKALSVITQQQYRTKIMDIGKEAPLAVLTDYHGVGKDDLSCAFGWPYLDAQTGGIVGGDVVSFVGRPAQGKSWMMLYIALYNWTQKHRNVLFVSMEMAPLPIAQRIASMYAGTPYGQLKMGGYSSQTYKKFSSGLTAMQGEGKKLYVVDGNLAVGVDEVYALADLLGCDTVMIDGAYLMKHRDKRMDRFTRVAENVESMKLQCSDFGLSTFASWQFNRQAAKLKKGEQAGLEDIGMSDSIPQISSIVLGMEQEDSVETMVSRKIKVMKGRSGEIGHFGVNWDFQKMDFSEVNLNSNAQIPMEDI